MTVKLGGCPDLWELRVQQFPYWLASDLPESLRIGRWATVHAANDLLILRSKHQNVSERWFHDGHTSAPITTSAWNSAHSSLARCFPINTLSLTTLTDILMIRPQSQKLSPNHRQTWPNHRQACLLIDLRFLRVLPPNFRFTFFTIA